MSEQRRLLRVVLIEDDADVRAAIAQSLELEGMQVDAFGDAGQILETLDRGFPGAVITDIRLPGKDGREVFRTLLARDAELPVILITGHGELQEAVDLMREGAYDFISKPFAVPRLLVSVRNALEQRLLVLENRRLRERRGDSWVPQPLLGESTRIAQVRNVVRELASTDVAVLVTGEPGSGKGLVARALHDLGSRRSRAFVAFDCTSVPAAMLDVELFGTEVTVGGMTRHRPGRLETAERGTILLNNIDRLPATEQGRLLRSFEDGVITSTAGGIDRAIHCRIVAAAARNLTTLRESGEFRSDLYYFLNTVTLELPPLRERHEDLPALMVELLARAAARLKRPAPSLTRALSKHLFEHDWPGNLRELAQFADRVVLGIERSMPSRTVSQLESLPERVDRFEESALRQTLRATHGDVRSCLDLLKIPRKTFYDKLTRYGVDIGAYRASIVDQSRK